MHAKAKKIELYEFECNFKIWLSASECKVFKEFAKFCFQCTQLWAAFPNPSNSGFIHFYRKNKKETSGTYTLFDAQGKMRKSGNLELNFQNKFQLMLSTEGLSSGVYLMQFILEGKIDTIRVVIL